MVNDRDQDYCKVYVEVDLGPQDLANLLAETLSGAVSGVATAPSVRTALGEIDVRPNDDADKAGASTFPDGFLFFRFALEVYPAATVSRENRISLVTRILRFLWSRAMAAVAACDYESELPFGGGYNNRSVPWVPRELLPR